MHQSKLISVNSIFHIPRPSRLADIVRSRFQPPYIDLETVQNVLARYKLDLIGDPSNLPLSRRTENVIQNTSAGRMVLKRYRPFLQEEGIIYSHSIIMRLAALKFAAPRLMVTPDGDNFASLNGRYYALFDYVQGINYSLELLFRSDRYRLVIIAGQILARFHSDLRDFNPAGEHHLGFASRDGGWRRDIAWYEKKAQELKQKSIGIRSEKDRSDAIWLAENCYKILDRLNQLDDHLRTALPRLIIHGDFGLHNLIFQKNGTVALTDFETTRLEWRLGDLAVTLSRNRTRDQSFNIALSKSFLRGYQSVFPISKEEWGFFPDVWHFYKLRSVIIHWNSYFESGEAGVKLSAARAALRQADWAMNHRDQLLELKNL